MNYITIVIISLTVAPILFGVLLGLLRGWRRSALRLALVVLSIVLAFALCGVVSQAVLDFNITKFIPGEGMDYTTVSEYIQQTMLPGMPEGISNLAIALVQSIVKVVMFLLLFGLFMFLTWAIVYPICKIFVKPKTTKDADGRVVKKKHRLIGAAVGLVQGAVVAVCVCLVLTGLLVQTNKIVTIANGLDSLPGETETYAMYNDDGDVDYDPDDGYTSDDFVGEQPSDNPLGEFGEIGDMISEYTDSALGKFYNSIGAKPFDWISQVKTADGKKITLSGTIDAFRGVVDMAKELMRFQDIDFIDLLQEGNVQALRDIFNALQEINKNLSAESKDTIKGVLSSLGEEMGLPFDISDVDFNSIDFAKEGEIFADLYEYNKNSEISPEEAQDIVEKIADSNIILGFLEGQADADLGSQLEQEHLRAIEEKIDEMEQNGYDQGKIDALRNIFGLE